MSLSEGIGAPVRAPRPSSFRTIRLQGAGRRQTNGSMVFLHTSARSLTSAMPKSRPNTASHRNVAMGTIPDILPLSSHKRQLYILGIGSSDVRRIRWMRKGAMPDYPTLGRREYLTAAVGVAGLIVLTFLVFVLAEWVGRHECPSPGCGPNEIAKAISDARTALLQIIVGMAGAAALYFTWQTYLLGREGRASDNFIKAIDQLGNQTVPARVGAIVGLGRLLRTATPDGDYWPLMDVLTAFLRQSVPVTDTPRGTKPSEDIQAAMTILARRSCSTVPMRIYDSPVDLSQCDLSYLWMAGGHYEGGYFGDSVFRKTDLRNASLGHANFDRTDILGAQFEGAKMQDAKVRWVKHAQETSFKDADLTRADFEGADVTGCSFQGANVSAADFSKAILQPGQLLEARGDSTTQLPPGYARPPNW